MLEARRLTRLLSLPSLVMGTALQGRLPSLFSPIDATLERVDVFLNLGPRNVLPRRNRRCPKGCRQSQPRCVCNALDVTSIPQQTVPTSAASLSSGFPQGIRFLGNPTTICPTPDGLLLGQERQIVVTSFPVPFGGRGRCLCCSPEPLSGSKGDCWISPTVGPLTFCLRPVNPRWPVASYDDSDAEFVFLHLPT